MNQANGDMFKITKKPKTNQKDIWFQYNGDGLTVWKTQNWFALIEFVSKNEKKTFI